MDITLGISPLAAADNELPGEYQRDKKLFLPPFTDFL
jgi:hypothetical protein